MYYYTASIKEDFMFKPLPSVEKEFNMKEVDKATPNWLKFVMLIFVILLFIGISIIDSTALANDICTLEANSKFIMMENKDLMEVTNDLPGEMVIMKDENQPTEKVLSALTELLGEDWSDGVGVWDEAYNILIVHRADLVDCLSQNEVLIIPAE